MLRVGSPAFAFDHVSAASVDTNSPAVVAAQQKANPYLADRRGTLYPTLIEEQARP